MTASNDSLTTASKSLIPQVMLAWYAVLFFSWQFRPSIWVNLVGVEYSASGVCRRAGSDPSRVPFIEYILCPYHAWLICTRSQCTIPIPRCRSETGWIGGLTFTAIISIGSCISARLSDDPATG